MLIQYSYALLTMVPCSLWFWYRWPSAMFLTALFSWSIYNGATYYIDVFGKRFQNELEQLKKEVAKWQTGSPHALGEDGPLSPYLPSASATGMDQTPLLERHIQAIVPEGSSAPDILDPTLAQERKTQ